MVHVVAVDPGPHTGLAWRELNGHVGTEMIYDHREAVWTFIKNLEPSIIVVERFIASGRIAAPGLYTVEIAGSMMSLGWSIGAKVVMRTPSQRYPRMAEAKQILAGRKHTDHDVDALAHLLVYEVLERQGKDGPFVVGHSA